MKILILEKRPLYPLDAGGQIRSAKMFEELSKEHEITIVCNVEHPRDDKYLDEMYKCCAQLHTVPWKETMRFSWKFYCELFVNLFSRYPFTVNKDYCPKLKRLFEKVLADGEFDLIICDFLQSSRNVLGVKNIPKLLFQHNVESMIAKRHFKEEENIVAKCYWYIQWKKMEWYEKKMCQWFDHVIAVSENDKDMFEKHFSARAVSVIPTGVDVECFCPQNINVESNTLVFVGGMDWLPNEDGIIYFTKEILPLIQKEIPAVQLYVVGRNPTEKIERLGKVNKAIIVTGSVEDVRPYIAKAQVSIVPLRIGGGTRLKIYQFMAMAKPVVSTTIGAEGLTVTHGEDILLADTPDRFAREVINLLNNSKLREDIGKAGEEMVNKYYSWDKITKCFEEICKKILSTRG